MARLHRYKVCTSDTWAGFTVSTTAVCPHQHVFEMNFTYQSYCLHELAQKCWFIFFLWDCRWFDLSDNDVQVSHTFAQAELFGLSVCCHCFISKIPKRKSSFELEILSPKGSWKRHHAHDTLDLLACWPAQSEGLTHIQNVVLRMSQSFIMFVFGLDVRNPKVVLGACLLLRNDSCRGKLQGMVSVFTPSRSRLFGALTVALVLVFDGHSWACKRSCSAWQELSLVLDETLASWVHALTDGFRQITRNRFMDLFSLQVVPFTINEFSMYMCGSSSVHNIIISKLSVLECAICNHSIAREWKVRELPLFWVSLVKRCEALPQHRWSAFGTKESIFQKHKLPVYFERKWSTK